MSIAPKKERNGYGVETPYTEERPLGTDERRAAWEIAKGLQKVDGLTTSRYLDSVAEDNISGKITAYQARDIVDSYYNEKQAEIEQPECEEADKVSARINILINERAFSLSPTEFVNIHRRLFEGVFPFAGQYRQTNLSKAEWVLGGESVLYNDFRNIGGTLEFDMSEERKTDYRKLSSEEELKKVAHFISYLWQNHPFREGNTRTTAVFTIKYLRKLGYKVDNEPFKENSRYFQDALVRANYNDASRGIKADETYLVRFLENACLGAKHILKSRNLHVDAPSLTKQTEIKI